MKTVPKLRAWGRSPGRTRTRVPSVVARSSVTGAAVALLASSLAVPLLATPGAAGPNGIVSGRVMVDADANGVVDTSGRAGEIDLPLAGVKVTLKGQNEQHPGWKVRTAEDGTWSFPKDDGDFDYDQSPGPYTVTIDAEGVAGDLYATSTTTSADNDFTRVPEAAQLAVSEPFDLPVDGAPPVMLDGLVYPVWAFDLALANDPEGYMGMAVYTGSAPFDAYDADGKDSSAANNRVRSGDTVAYNWSITLAPDPALAESIPNATFEQTITLEEGAKANFARIPAICESSSITAHPTGTVVQPRTDPPAGTTSLTLTCNLGIAGEDRAAILLATSIWVSGNSVADSRFSTTARTFAATSGGTAVARPSSPDAAAGPFEITSAAPSYDLKKWGFLYTDQTTATFNGVPNTQVFRLYSVVTVSTDRRDGSEALQQPITIDENFWGEYNSQGQNGSAGSMVPDLQYVIDTCAPVTPGNLTLPSAVPVWGRAHPNALEGSSVSDSGTCTTERVDPSDLTSSYRLTFTGIDMSAASFPTKTAAGKDLAKGPFYVASYLVRISVPVVEVDRSTGSSDDKSGSLDFYNRVAAFDPDSLSGASNFGDGFEPGYCPSGPTADRAQKCHPMEDGSLSNNVVGPKTLTMGNGASWHKSAVDNIRAWASNYRVLPQMTSLHDGRAQVSPGEVHGFRLALTANAHNALTNPAQCDVFDNTVARLSPLNRLPGETSMASLPDSLYSYVLSNGMNAAQNQANQANYTIEYAHVDLSADDPYTGTFDVKNGRWEGDWSRQRAASCDDVIDTDWQLDPNAVPGGIDEVNIVRMTSADGLSIAPQGSISWWLAFEQRDTFYGGAHDGDPIPNGTVFANFGRFRTDEVSPGWNPVSYVPGAGTLNGKHQAGEQGGNQGDRWTVARATAAVQKRTIAADVGRVTSSGVADFDATGTARAGSPVVWEIVASLAAVSSSPAPVPNVVITDTLPKYVTYDEVATSALDAGTPASSYTENADGTTTLIWNLGAVTPNKALPPLRIVTITDSLAPSGTSLVNTATITADGVPPNPAHTDQHTVRLEQTGEMQLKKSVDHTLDLQDDQQAYRLQVQNFSEALSIQAPTVIDVLPYKADGSNSAAVTRAPASDYEGTSTLSEAPKAFQADGSTPAAGTFYYTTKAPAEVPQNVDDDSDPSLWTTVFTPDATAFKFVAGGPLGAVGSGPKSGLVITYTTDQEGNEAGDLYANRFTAFSDTLMNGSKHQLLASNQTTARVVGFSLGDLIWIEKNHDGRYTQGVDQPAPKGVQVEVYRTSEGGRVATATTDANGRWVVNDLPDGEYYALIPARQFSSDGPLAGLHAYPGSSSDPNDDQNEDHRHDAQPADARGVFTKAIRLSATVDGNRIQGDEPLGDNVSNAKLTPLTTDDFTNLTLDIALYSTGFQVQKVGIAVDNSVVPMDGSTWALRADADGTPGPAISGSPVKPVAGTTGRFQVGGLQAGTYWIEETKAPDGFALLAEPVAFTVAVDGTVALVDPERHRGVVDAGVTEDAVGVLIVHDVSSVRLPTTGGRGQGDLWTALGLFALLLAGLGAGWSRMRPVSAGPRHAARQRG